MASSSIAAAAAPAAPARTPTTPTQAWMASACDKCALPRQGVLESLPCVGNARARIASVEAMTVLSAVYPEPPEALPVVLSAHTAGTSTPAMILDIGGEWAGVAAPFGFVVTVGERMSDTAICLQENLPCSMYLPMATSPYMALNQLHSVRAPLTLILISDLSGVQGLQEILQLCHDNWPATPVVGLARTPYIYRAATVAAMRVWQKQLLPPSSTKDLKLWCANPGVLERDVYDMYFVARMPLCMESDVEDVRHAIEQDAPNALQIALMTLKATAANSMTFPLAVWAARLNAPRILRWLVRERGTEVLSITHDGCSPLHHAAWHGNGQVLRNLLRLGADGKAKDKEGLTVEGVLRKRKHIAVLHKWRGWLRAAEGEATERPPPPPRHAWPAAGEAESKAGEAAAAESKADEAAAAAAAKPPLPFKTKSTSRRVRALHNRHRQARGNGVISRSTAQQRTLASFFGARGGVLKNKQT